MRLFLSPMAPNAMRVLVFMKEKGLSIPIENVDMMSGGHKKPEFLKINPLGQVPALVLNDGHCLSESLVICQYLDALSNSPSLFGDTPTQRAVVAMWERRAELGLFIPAIDYGHQTHPMFKALTEQSPEVAAFMARQISRTLPILEEQLQSSAFLAGDTFSVADITAYLGYRATLFFGMPESQSASFKDWLGRIGSRESMKVLG